MHCGHLIMPLQSPPPSHHLQYILPVKLRFDCTCYNEYQSEEVNKQNTNAHAVKGMNESHEKGGN